MEKYYSMHLVKSEDLNHHGTLFAARTASWLVEAAFIAAASTHGNSEEIVCRNIHGMQFKCPVNCGDIVKFSSRVVRAGKTSLTVFVDIESELYGIEPAKGYITFVVVSKHSGKKIEHGLTLDEPEDEKERLERDGAEALFK